MKRVLIISPHYPPVNAADMHRVRHSLPYFKELGWEAEVIAVDSKFVEANSLDELLLNGIPEDNKVHYVKAWEIHKARMFGLGSLSIRSFLHFRKKGNALLRSGKFDLVYFSTTAFHVMALGPYWQRKYKVPFILDIQDPWRNDFYLDKPKSERPPKFYLNYCIDKYLEKKTIPKATGIISVSKGYNDIFLERYSNLKPEKLTVIPFAASSADFEIMHQHVRSFEPAAFTKDKTNIVYIGRGGHDLGYAIEILFAAFEKGLKQHLTGFKNVHFWFLGTSYAPKGTGKQTILPVAIKYGLEKYVTESPDRLTYFETLFLLEKADILFVPGSVDKAYTASKLYPYILAKKPLFGIFYHTSSVVEVLKKTKAGDIICFETVEDPEQYIELCLNLLVKLISQKDWQVQTDWEAFESYSAFSLTKAQVNFFEKVLS